MANSSIGFTLIADYVDTLTMRNTVAIGLCCLLLLSSCSSLTAPTDITADKALKPSAVAPVQAVEPTYGSFSTDTLYSLLVAELAASRQQYPITLNNYIDAAETTKDLGIIARAARLAQYFRAHQQTLAMGDLWLAQAPDDIEANGIVATAYIELQQPLKALDYAEKILALLNSDNDEAEKSAAITETIANFSRDSDSLTRKTLIQRYLTLDKHYPQYPAIKVGLSTLYETDKDTATAYRVIEEALVQNSSYVPAIMQKIRLLQASKQTDEALATLKDILDKRPDDYRLRLLYARLLAQTDIQAAYDEFTRLSQQSPNHLDITFSRALIALELKKREEAEQLLTELLALNYRPDTIHFYLGNLAELNTNNALALDHYLAVTSGEDYIVAHSRAARLMATEGDIADAQAHFEKLRAKSPEQSPQLYAAEAEVFDQLKQSKPALEALNRALAIFPDNTNLRYSRATLYEKTHQLGLMENDLRHILTLEPENASALNALGYFLTSRTERHTEALALIEKALTLKPEDPAIIDSMGWVLFNLGRNDEAIQYLRRAYEAFPDPEVAAHLGEALWVNGKQQEARTVWRNNLKDNPNDSRILDTMERLQVRP